MNMQDISDNELDQLFKNSMENPELPFDKEAWAKMEQSLNKHDRRQSQRRFRNGVLLLLAVYMLSTVSVRTPEYVADHRSSYIISAKNNTTKAVTKEPMASVAEQKTNLSTEHNTQPSWQQYHTPTASDDSHKNNSSVYGKTPINKGDKNSSGFSNHTNNKSIDARGNKERERERERERETHLQISANGKTHSRKHNKEESYLASSTQETLLSSSDKNNQESSVLENTNADQSDQFSGKVIIPPSDQSTFVVQNEETHRTSNTEDPLSAASLADTSTLTTTRDTAQVMLPKDSLLPVAAETKKDSTVKKDQSPIRRHFSFGIFASPDFSFSSSAQFVAPGISEGIFIEYHYNKRFSLFAGLMHSSKIYSTSASDYEATNKYWAYKGYTSRIDGSCAVLDVPVNLKYHFYNKGKNLLFAAAGISSYFMLHEEYSFIYKDGSPERSWQHTKKENYLFSIVNASVGYEHYLGKSFSVQLEPFIKIPLSTIGQGDIKLLTTGMFVYLKYSIK